MREQIGIRTNKATKDAFEAVEGSTSNDKLERLLNVYNGLRNVPEDELVANTVELLDKLKFNFIKMESIVIPEQEKYDETENLKLESEELKRKLELLENKYKQLNQEYSNLIIKYELENKKR